jgi:hypothetical protein
LPGQQTARDQPPKLRQGGDNCATPAACHIGIIIGDDRIHYRLGRAFWAGEFFGQGISHWADLCDRLAKKLTGNRGKCSVPDHVNILTRSCPGHHPRPPHKPQSMNDRSRLRGSGWECLALRPDLSRPLPPKARKRTSETNEIRASTRVKKASNAKASRFDIACGDGLNEAHAAKAEPSAIAAEHLARYQRPTIACLHQRPLRRFQA